jgi:hypothetical protein
MVGSGKKVVSENMLGIVVRVWWFVSSHHTMPEELPLYHVW